MPQLIAMIIIVVGAMIYMFQTFGGTGDKIEGIAQKASVITEINNVKNAVKLAARAQQLVVSGAGTEADPTVATNMKGLATLKYFAEQMNDQIENNDVPSSSIEDGDKYVKENAYNAISFGGTDKNIGGMFVSLVADKEDAIPGIFVSFNFKNSTLADSAGFLESQIANDLKDIAYIDRKATEAKSGAFTAGTGRKTDNDDTAIAKRTPQDNTGNDDLLSDGKFIIYFKDFGANEVVVK